MNNLIHNSLMTPDGTVLVSRYRHDYVTHTDKNGKEYMVDGGIDYGRFSIHEDAPHTDLCLYDDEPHKVQRWVIRWGTYGKDGKQPLTLKPIAEMDTGHIELVLQDHNPTRVYRACMEKELEYRKGLSGDQETVQSSTKTGNSGEVQL